MEIVKLKNGSEEPQPAVAAAMLSLRSLWTKKPIVAFEFVELCRDPNHKLFAGESDLKASGLLGNDGRVHGTIRNVVLSAFEGEGLEMSLHSPYAPT